MSNDVSSRSSRGSIRSIRPRISIRPIRSRRSRRSSISRRSRRSIISRRGLPISKVNISEIALVVIRIQIPLSLEIIS